MKAAWADRFPAWFHAEFGLRFEVESKYLFRLLGESAVLFWLILDG